MYVRFVPYSTGTVYLKAYTGVTYENNSFKGYDNDAVFISHGDCLKDAEYVAEQVKKRFGIENIMINFVSPTVGAHSGPGTLALFYMGENR